jgi:hypothetical protein
MLLRHMEAPACSHRRASPKPVNSEVRHTPNPTPPEREKERASERDREREAEGKRERRGARATGAPPPSKAVRVRGGVWEGWTGGLQILLQVLLARAHSNYSSNCSSKTTSTSHCLLNHHKLPLKAPQLHTLHTHTLTA